MSAKRFLDTNVLFYSCDSSDPAKQAVALQLIGELSTEGAGLVSTQVLGEFFHATVVRRKLLTAAEAERVVRDYGKTFQVVGIDFEIVCLAMEIHRRFQISYWDSLIVATASCHGCSEVVSEDFSPGQIYHGVRAVNPFQPKPKQ